MPRLIDHLRSLGLSNREAKAALASGKVYVDDAPTADAVREIEGTCVEVRATAPRAVPWRDVIVVFSDIHLAVVAKPAAALAVPAPGRRGAKTVVGEVRRFLGEAHAVHRLDEDTSGLMLVARTEACQLALKELFARHDIERRYLAIVAGDFPAEPVRIESELVRDRGDGRRGSGEGGKRAISHFERVRTVGPRRTLLEARLETGRTHQIRIHLSELGFPILGDKLYGEPAFARAVPRLALHAAVLGFRHPMTGAAHRFSAPLADDLERALRAR